MSKYKNKPCYLNIEISLPPYLQVKIHFSNGNIEICDNGIFLNDHTMIIPMPYGAYAYNKADNKFYEYHPELLKEKSTFSMITNKDDGWIYDISNCWLESMDIEAIEIELK